MSDTPGRHAFGADAAVQYPGLSATEIGELERRRARVEQAFADDVVLCSICGVRIRDYCAAMAAADWRDPGVIAFADRPPFNPPTLSCRHRNAATECQVHEQIRRRFDDPIPFPSRPTQ